MSELSKFENFDLEWDLNSRPSGCMPDADPAELSKSWYFYQYLIASSFTLTESDKMLLSKGLNFALPENVIPYEDFMLPYEVFYRGIKHFAKTPEDQINFHARLKNVAVSSFSSFKQQNRAHANLTSAELESLNTLMENANIVIQRADKGNTVVICDKSDYVERMKELIQDDSKFTNLSG